ncbi:hypothetical protein EVAR_34632_1 [Eumeta japonica]|uniref:Uncharacterized protein n=1 Tax=Eumeta variegata TaxID=151549 RepID=A0A4C1VFG8_EUMVA|nr:hypothetical protein EVAR_34632_1 [Eumeta japonica]
MALQDHDESSLSGVQKRPWSMLQEYRWRYEDIIRCQPIGCRFPYVGRPAPLVQPAGQQVDVPLYFTGN